MLLVGIPLRLYPLLEGDFIPLPYLVLYALLGFAIAIAMSIDVVSSAKLVFKQLFEMHRQKECFRTILSSFPEGVMIAKVTHLSAGESSYCKDGPLRSEGGGNHDDVSDQSDSEERSS